jgi:hypothetical protein
MTEGKYEHLIDVRMEATGFTEGQAKIEKAMGTVDEGGKISAKTAAQINSLTDSMSRMGLSKDRIKQVFQQFAPDQTNLKLTSAQIQQFTNSMSKAGASGVQIKGVTNDLQKLGLSAKEGVSYSDDFVRALRRVAIVAPVWMAARAAIQFFTQGLGEGYKSMINFDIELTKLREVLRATGQVVDLSVLTHEFEKLSIETGKAVENIVTVYKTMIKNQIDAKDAMDATSAAVKLQEINFTKSDVAVRAFAKANEILGNTLPKTVKESEKFDYIAATIHDTVLKSSSELDEFSQDFLSLISTMDMTGTTFTQFISILGVLESRGVKNVQGLKQAFISLLTQPQKLAANFGMVIKEGESAFQVLLAIAEKVKATPEGSIEYNKLLTAIKNLSGGSTRGGIIALTELGKAVDDLKNSVANLEFPNKVLNGFNSDVNKLNESIGHQQEIVNNLKISLFRAFEQGLFGGKNYAETLKNVGAVMDALIPKAKALGEAIASLNPAEGMKRGEQEATKYIEETNKKIKEALSDKLSLADTVKLIGEEEAKLTYKSTVYEKLFIQILKDRAQELILQGKQEVKINAITDAEKNRTDAMDGALNKIEKENHAEDELLDKTRNKLNIIRDEIELEKLKAKGVNAQDIAYAAIIMKVKHLKEEYDRMTYISGKALPSLNEQELIQSILNGDVNKESNLLKGVVDLEEKLGDLSKLTENNEKAKLIVEEKRISDKLKLLGLEGVSRKELLLQEIAMRIIKDGAEAVAKNEEIIQKILEEQSMEVNDQVKYNLDLLKAQGLSNAELLKAKVYYETLKRGAESVKNDTQLQHEIQLSNLDTEQLLVDHELEILRIRGLSGFELFKAKTALESQITGQKDYEKTLKACLDLDTAMTQQKRDQFSISDTNLKLLRIAKKEGVATAKAMADILAGTRKYPVTGSEYERIFKQNFSKEAIAYQANVQLGRLGFSYESEVNRSARTKEEREKKFPVLLPPGLLKSPITGALITNFIINLEATEKDIKSKAEKVAMKKEEVIEAIRNSKEFEKLLFEKIDLF